MKPKPNDDGGAFIGGAIGAIVGSIEKQNQGELPYNIQPYLMVLKVMRKSSFISLGD